MSAAPLAGEPAAARPPGVVASSPRYRWVVLAVGCLGTMVTGALRQGLPALGPAFRDAFALSVGQVGWVFGALAVGMTLALVPFGALADRIGERPVLGLGLGGTAAALVLAALAESFGALLAGLFLTGLLGASATGASGRAVMGWFGRAERGFALGIRQTAIPVGGALCAVTLPAIAVAAGLREALLALAGFSLLAAVAGAVWLRDPPPPPAARVGEAPVDSPPPMRDGRIWRLGLGSALLVLAQAAIIGFVVLFLHDARGLSYTVAAAGLAAIQIGSAVTRIALGRRSDRTERRIAPMRATGLVGAALLLCAALVTDGPGVLLYPLLFGGGVAVASWNGLAFTAAAEITGRARAGAAMSAQNTLVSVGSALAAPAFGWLVDRSSWGLAYGVFALAPLAGWLVLGPLVADEERRAARRELRLRAA